MKKLIINFLKCTVVVMLIAGLFYQIGYMRVGSSFYRPGEFFSGKVRDLALAAQRGDVVKINRLVKEGVDPNTVGKKNTTVLLWAVASSNEKGVEALLKNGANPNYIPPKGSELEGESVTYLLSEGVKTQLLKIVLENGGDPNVRNPSPHGNNATALIAAAKQGGYFENLKLLVEHGADVNAKDNDGMTALLWAIFFNQFDKADYLLNNRANYKIVANYPGLSNSKVSICDLINESLRAGLADAGIPQREKVIKFLENRGVKIDRTPEN